MAIIHQEFPRRRLTEEEGNNIIGDVTVLIHALAASPEGRDIPRFLGCWYADGMVKVNCKEENSKLWLEGTIATLGASLKVCLLDQLPKLIAIYFWLPGKIPEKTEEVTKVLLHMNPPIKDGVWRPVGRWDKQKPLGATLKYLLDEPTWETLKKEGKTLYWGLTRVIVHESELGNSAAAKTKSTPMEEDEDPRATVANESGSNQPSA
jgi:hypothetical protein